jgi:hypothetical protein
VALGGVDKEGRLIITVGIPEESYMAERKQATRYPWDKWFAKSKFVLTKGVDFNCMAHSMIVQLRNVAASRGVSVSVRSEGNILSVTVKGR